MAKRPVTLFSFLSIVLLPCVLVPGLGAILYDTLVYGPAEKAENTSRNQILVSSLVDDLDREIDNERLILDVFNRLLQNVEIPTQENIEKLNDFFNKQDSLRDILLVNREGHILWKTSKNKLNENPQVDLPSREVELEVRYDGENNSLEFHHFKSLQKNFNGMMLVGISDLGFLDKKCQAINSGVADIQMVIFSNHSKLKPLECGNRSREPLADVAEEHQYRKLLNDIKQSIYDNRYKMEYPKNFVTASSSRSPIKIAIVPHINAINNHIVSSDLAYSLALILSSVAILFAIKSSGYFILRPLRELHENLRNKETIKYLDIAENSQIREINEHLKTVIESSEFYEEQRIRTRVMQKALMELFSSDTVDLLLAKSIELLGTQTEAIHVLFIPEKYGSIRQYENVEVFIGVHAWSWYHLKVNKLEKIEVDEILQEIKETRTYDFRIKILDSVVGVVKVYFDKTPNDFVLSIMHGLISLVETTLSKHESVKKETMITAELELATMVQETVVDQKFVHHGNLDFSYHFQPSSRLGGDWFYVFESGKGRYLNFFIGDVSGNGLTQGLVATAVKGAMDMLVEVAKAYDDLDLTPGVIVRILDRVMKRVLSKRQLTMSCLAAQIDYQSQTLKICNAGHLFPIIIRKSPANSEVAGENQVIYLSKVQSPLIDYVTHQTETKFFENSTYKLENNDMILLYTDGLSGSKNIKSSIFTKLLQRKLRQIDLEETPEKVRNDVLSIFQYYTQENKIDDDVCFMVVKFRDEKILNKIKIAV